MDKAINTVVFTVRAMVAGVFTVRATVVLTVVVRAYSCVYHRAKETVDLAVEVRAVTNNNNNNNNNNKL